MRERSVPETAALPWSPALDTGIADVDREHRQLLRIFNRVAATRDAAPLRAALRALARYARHHFATEARLMRQWPVDSGHREAHQRAHRRFANFIDRALALVDHEPLAVGDELTGFLAQWLQHHIMGMDARMARAILALQRGQQATLESIGDTLDSVLDGLGERTFALLEANRRLRDEIARRRRAQESLRASESRYRELFMQAPDALLELDAQQRIALVNDAGVRLLGAGSAAELRAQPIDRFVAESAAPLPRQALLRRVDGGAAAVEVLATAADARGARRLLLRDVGAHSRLQRAATEAARIEQERLARELHDGAGQRLVAIGLFATALHRNLRSDGRDSDSALAAELATHAAQTLDEIRRLAHGLAPLPLGGGLHAALDTLCAGLHCAFSGTHAADAIDKGVALQLYRIAQEALSNALRHGGASHVGLRLDADADTVTLCVRDDGCGIGTGANEGLGMSTMRHRASSIGASLDVDTPAGGGTEVRCRWPRPH